MIGDPDSMALDRYLICMETLLDQFIRMYHSVKYKTG